MRPFGVVGPDELVDRSLRGGQRLERLVIIEQFPALGTWPLVVRSITVVLPVVAIMTWIVMPGCRNGSPDGSTAPAPEAVLPPAMPGLIPRLWKRDSDQP